MSGTMPEAVVSVAAGGASASSRETVPRTAAAASGGEAFAPGSAVESGLETMLRQASVVATTTLGEAAARDRAEQVAGEMTSVSAPATTASDRETTLTQVSAPSSAIASALKQAPAPPSPAIHGIVLAGGRSSRMGTDKARLAVDGVPLLRRIVEAIAPLCRGVTVVVPAADPQRYADLLGPDTAIAVDRYADKGPLAGIHAGLLTMPDECGCGFVIACDMPLFSPQLFRRMAAELTGHNPAPAAVLCPGQPLHALYRRTAAQTAERLLAAGRLQLLALADSLHTAYVEPEADCFLNLNTPEEWRAYVRSLDGAGQDAF